MGPTKVVLDFLSANPDAVATCRAYVKEHPHLTAKGALGIPLLRVTRKAPAALEALVAIPNWERIREFVMGKQEVRT